MIDAGLLRARVQGDEGVYILQRGVQWKQGVVICMVLYTILLYDTTPIHCTPLRLHPPLQSLLAFWTLGSTARLVMHECAVVRNSAVAQGRSSADTANTDKICTRICTETAVQNLYKICSETAVPKICTKSVHRRNLYRTAPAAIQGGRGAAA